MGGHVYLRSGMLDAADLELACGADGAGALCAECLPDAGGPEASGAGGECEGCCCGGHCIVYLSSVSEWNYQCLLLLRLTATPQSGFLRKITLNLPLDIDVRVVT